MRTCAAKVQLLSECRISHSSQSTYFDAVALGREIVAWMRKNLSLKVTATKIDKAGIFQQKAVNVTSKAIFSGGDGFPRAQPRRGPESAFHQGRGLFGV